MNTKVSQLYGIGLDSEIRRIIMQLQMQIQKKTDGLSLRNLSQVLKEQDVHCCGVLNYEDFEKGLRKYG